MALNSFCSPVVVLSWEIIGNLQICLWWVTFFWRLWEYQFHENSHVFILIFYPDNDLLLFSGISWHWRGRFSITAIHFGQKWINENCETEVRRSRNRETTKFCKSDTSSSIRIDLLVKLMRKFFILEVPFKFIIVFDFQSVNVFYKIFYQFFMWKTWMCWQIN